MGAFRRKGTIMTTSQAQTMLDDGFGIDVRMWTPLGTLYNKNGRWGGTHQEQSLAYFLPQNMELVVLANSPIGAPAQFFRDVVTNIYVANIKRRVYDAVWRPGSSAEVQYYGLKYADYQKHYDDLWKQNYRIYLLNTYEENGQRLYDAVWRPGTSAEGSILWLDVQRLPEGLRRPVEAELSPPPVQHLRGKRVKCPTRTMSASGSHIVRKQIVALASALRQVNCVRMTRGDATLARGSPGGCDFGTLFA
jgi:hypothetical protein